MKIILSRKGFDSSAGGVPSPILPDGRLLSLPIPDKHSPLRYDGIETAGMNLGPLVEKLTRGKVRRDYRVHLDPDLHRTAVSRKRGWKPIFGQAGAAQRVLENHDVGPGDLFLFFGWFRQAEADGDSIRFARGAPDLHVVFGWLAVERVLTVDRERIPAWAADHPHLSELRRTRNTLYLGADAGLMERLEERLVLTAPGASRSVWSLPEWFHPTGNRPALGYHEKDRSRWSKVGDSTILRTVPRGQEFVLDADAYPEAEAWARSLIRMW